MLAMCDRYLAITTMFSCRAQHCTRPPWNIQHCDCDSPSTLSTIERNRETHLLQRNCNFFDNNLPILPSEAFQ